MLNGTRDGILQKLQPVSIHGQVSFDVVFADPDDPDQVHVARVGAENVDQRLHPGDRIRLEYLMGVVTSVSRA